MFEVSSLSTKYENFSSKNESKFKIFPYLTKYLAMKTYQLLN